jgi:hypothetical protein
VNIINNDCLQYVLTTATDVISKKKKKFAKKKLNCAALPCNAEVITFVGIRRMTPKV